MARHGRLIKVQRGSKSLPEINAHHVVGNSPELTYFSVQMLKRIRSIFLDQEFLRSRIPEKKYLFLAKRILYPSEPYAASAGPLWRASGRSRAQEHAGGASVGLLWPRLTVRVEIGNLARIRVSGAQTACSSAPTGRGDRRCPCGAPLAGRGPRSTRAGPRWAPFGPD